MLLVILTFCFNGYAQDMPDLKGIWEQIKQSISDGSFNPENWDLERLVSGSSFDMSQLPGGRNKLNFDEGGFMGDIFGGLFGGLFGDGLMSAMGIDELHNDASLNNNITWGIVFTMKMHPQIAKKQRAIMTQQDSINIRIKQLYELELLTAKYLSKTQNDAVDIEQERHLNKIKDDIAYLYPKCMSLCDDGDFTPSKIALTLKFATHLSTIRKKVNEFAKYDGNKNLLNNQDRDEIITFMYESMHEMRGTLSLAYRELFAASKWKKMENITEQL
jgi:hypothetical protein